jgi:hypothetical protein
MEKNEMGRACSAYGGGERRVQGLVGKPEKRNHWVDPGVDGLILLRWIFRKWDVGVGTGLSWLRIGKSVGHL